MKIEEEYVDVLQNIEAAIVGVFEENPNVVDRDVLAAIDFLIDGYQREKRGRGEVTRQPSNRARPIYEECRLVCEWRLGRQSLNDGELSGDHIHSEELSVSELIMCLKRLRKSIRLWHKQGGRQGYLTYVQQFFHEASSRTGI